MEVHPYSKMLKEAPCALIVCGDLDVSELFWIDDCAAATENILLAAKALGVGSCWCGLAHTDRCFELAEKMNLPENIRPYSLIALGYPNEEKPRPERVQAERIHHNQW